MTELEIIGLARFMAACLWTELEYGSIKSDAYDLQEMASNFSQITKQYAESKSLRSQEWGVKAWKEKMQEISK